MVFKANLKPTPSQPREEQVSKSRKQSQEISIINFFLQYYLKAIYIVDSYVKVDCAAQAQIDWPLRVSGRASACGVERGGLDPRPRHPKSRKRMVPVAPLLTLGIER